VSETRFDAAAEDEGEDEEGILDPPPTWRSRARAWAPLGFPLAVFGGIGALAVVGFLALASKPHVDDYAKATCAANDTHKVLVEVKQGDTGEAIAASLASADVVRSPEAFVYAVSRNSSGPAISAGTYRICPRISSATALAELLKPANQTADSIIEVKSGDYSWETVRALAAKRHWNPQDVQQVIAANQIGLPPWSKDGAGQWTVEGMLEPGRYPVGSSDTPQSVLATMVRARVKFLASVDLPASAADMMCSPTEHCTAQQALTIASLAEAEVTRPDPDGREVSEAVEHRLKNGDHLGVDATTRYWLSLQAGKRIDVTKREVDDPSDPYATGGHAGLPPTPVSIPSKAMITAVLNPTSDGWYFWCAKDGVTTFFKRSEEAAFDQACSSH
jgi:UPF0755 protein